VLTSGDKHKNDIGVIDFDPKTLNGTPFGEIPHKVIYVCPKYVNEKTPEPYRQWMTAINDSLDEEVDESLYDRPEIKKIFHHIKRDDITPKERAKMIDEYSLGLLENAAKKEGIEEGIEKGVLLVAKKLIAAKQLSIEQISEVTGLQIDIIKNISLEQVPV
jgi:predicted transposase/invertase (TIGR01784 family)